MVLRYNRKYDTLLQKKERGRETKGEDDLEEQTSLKTWGDLEIWGVYAVLIHEDHLTDPQICLNLKIVDEYPPWTVSSLKINGWKTKSPFGMAYFQEWTLRFRECNAFTFWCAVFLSPGNENNHGVTSCDLDLDEVQGVLIMVEVSQSQRPCVTGSCNWQQVSSPQSRNIKKLVILSILL